MGKQEHTPGPWLIYSREHQMWWRPLSRGYTKNICEAGRYSREYAEVICHEAGDLARDFGPAEFLMLAPEAADARSELLEACRALHAVSVPTGQDTRTDRAMELTRAALAKAKGE